MKFWDKVKKKLKMPRNKKIIVVICVFLILTIGVILAVDKLFLDISSNKAGKRTADNFNDLVDGIVGSEQEAELEELNIDILGSIKESQLNSFQQKYHALCPVREDDTSKAKKDRDILYYVEYQGRVKLGIDFSKVECKIDKEEEKIIIILPEIEIQDITVDWGSLDFLFVDQSVDDGSVHNEAYSECNKDLKNRVDDDKAKLVELAKENTEKSIITITKPLVQQYDEYEIEVTWKEDN